MENSFMTKQMKRMLVIVTIIFGIIFGIYGAKKLLFMYFMSHYEMPAVTISATTAKTKTWQSYLSAIGTLTAINGTDISSEAAGIITEIHFASGQFVNQGDVLIILDTEIEQAQLKNDQAKMKLAKINYERNQTLLKKNALSQSAFDTSLAELEEAQANLQVTQAKIKQKTIVAPFSGKIGIRQVSVGDYVAPGNAMVSLQSLDPLYVQFNLPEQNLPLLYLQQPIDISIYSNGKGSKVFHGVLTAINSKIEQATRNILVQATIPNKDLHLYPGMFAQVKVWLKAQNNIITLPQTAISYSLHGDSVFIINSDKKDKAGNPLFYVTRQYVKVGERRGDEVAILEGIKAGDQVVTSGQLKLQNNTHVVIDNTVEL
jgi:membrane fusion protein, multidrug efflux system